MGFRLILQNLEISMCCWDLTRKLFLPVNTGQTSQISQTALITFICGAAKVTGKTAKKLATKAAEKLIEKGAEKVGEKTGQLVGEKIYDKFSTKPSAATEGSERASERSESRPPEIKGKEIGEMLKAVSSPPARPFAPEKDTATRVATGRTFKKINNVYADLL